MITGVIKKEFIIESYLSVARLIRSCPPLLGSAVWQMWLTRANMSDKEFREHMEFIRQSAVSRLFARERA